ncbi:MAG: hypothetical protein HOG79_14640, partial [Prolixibacteraceae bacterium]|nr:hypothetical protein [Prolixibacteraceae bacterium]
MKTKINTYVAATLAALMLGASPVGAMASSESKDSVETVEETNVTERAEEMNGTLFTGAIVEPGTIDQIVKIDGHNGASIVGEAIHSPGFEREGAPSLRYDFGLQTPSFDFGEESDLQFYGVASFDLTTKDWAYTVGTRVGIDENIDTRFGVINKSQGDDWLIGGFGGAKVKTDHATVDLDLWLTNQTAGLHGFIAGADLGGLSEDSGLYLAIGGTAEIDYSGEWNKAIVNAVVGYDNDGGFGMHSFTFVDLVNGVQGGKIFLADKTTIDRGTHDFKEGMYNGT